MERLILDTGVLVEMSRGAVLIDGAEGDSAVPAVVIAEYRVGVLLDSNRTRASAQERFLDDLLTVLPVVDYTADDAVHHAELLAHVRRDGRPRGALDLVIAAMARATRRTLLTTDRRAGFEGLPGVEVRYLEV